MTSEHVDGTGGSNARVSEPHEHVAQLFQLFLDCPRSKVKELLLTTLGDASLENPTIIAEVFLSALQIRNMGKIDFFFFIITELALVYPQTVEDLIPLIPCEDWFKIIDFATNATTEKETYDLRSLVNVIIDLATDKLLMDEKALNRCDPNGISLLAKCAPCEKKGFNKLFHVLANKMFPYSKSPKKEYRELISRLNIAIDSTTDCFGTKTSINPEVNDSAPREISSNEAHMKPRDLHLQWQKNLCDILLRKPEGSGNTASLKRTQLARFLSMCYWSIWDRKRSQPGSIIDVSCGGGNISSETSLSMDKFWYKTFAADQDWVHLTIHEPPVDEAASSRVEASEKDVSQRRPDDESILGIHKVDFVRTREDENDCVGLKCYNGSGAIGSSDFRRGAIDFNAETEVIKCYTFFEGVVIDNDINVEDKEQNTVIQLNEVKRVLLNSNEGFLRHYRPSDVLEQEDGTANIADWQMI